MTWPEPRLGADDLDGHVAHHPAGVGQPAGGLPVSAWTPDAPAHRGSAVPNTLPRSPKAGGRQQGIADRVSGDVTVGVAASPATSGQTAGDPAGSPVLEGVHVDADAGARVVPFMARAPARHLSGEQALGPGQVRPAW